MKHVLASLTVGVCLLVPSASAVFAGQPGASAGVTCLNVSSSGVNATMTPGNAASAPGSVFNEPGTLTPAGGTAGQHYAGQPNTPSLQNGSANAVSQYDIACAKFTAAHQPP